MKNLPKPESTRKPITNLTEINEGAYQTVGLKAVRKSVQVIPSTMPTSGRNAYKPQNNLELGKKTMLTP